MGLFSIKRQQDLREGKRPPGPDQQLKPVHRLQYLAVLVLAFSARLVPNALARFMGATLGRLYYRIDEKRRHTALLNLDQVFGSKKSEAEKQRIVQNCCIHFGHALVEILRLAKITRANYREHVTIEGIEGFHEALAEGNGVILCSAHYGNWEIMNLVLGFLDLPMSVMARPMDNPLIHDYLEQIRTQSGNRVIYKHKSVRKLLTNLGENRIIGIVNDQDVHDRNRMMVPFFGHEAATTPVPAALSYKTGAPLITGYAVPRGKGHYLLRFDPLLRPDREADKDAEVSRLTLELNHRLEAQIEDHPDCWMWIHQRFKTGPDGRTDFYKQSRNPA